MRQWLIIGAIVVLLIGSYIWNRNRNASPDTDKVNVEEIITQEGGKVVRKIGDAIEEISPEEAEAKKKEITEKVADATPVALAAVDGQQGTGATKYVVDNGSYYQQIAVDNVPTLQKGYYYEGWLQKEDGSLSSIGRVEMSGSKGVLVYSAKEDKAGYNKVVVTREVEGRPGMGEKVLEGSLSK